MPGGFLAAMSVTASGLMQRACDATGLSHFGSSAFREGLDEVVEEIDRGKLTNLGERRLVARTTRRLCNRLVLEKWHEQCRPELCRERFGPIVVVGLPRSGTSALLCLLALDEGFRYLRRWETYELRPPQEDASEARDSRRLDAERYGAHGRPSPLTSFTINDVNGPQEDCELFGMEFRTPHLDLPLLHYRRWWRESDMAPALRCHERALQLLQHGAPTRTWLVKAPAHLFYLDAIVKQYPGTVFVMTHRDPVAAIVSWCELTEQVYRTMGGIADPGTLGPEALTFWAEGMKRALEARARLGEERFVDVENSELLENPLDCLHGIAERLNRDFTDQAGLKAERFMSVNRPRTRDEPYGVSAARYGLSVAKIEGAFEHYRHEFGR
jgi:hypothetical protein